MFDGHFRANAERTLQPVGAQIKRTGITADQLTATGIVMAIGASLAIANGALRLGLLLLFLTGVPDLLDGAVAKASGTASPRGAFFDSVADRFTDAVLFGGVAWYLATTHPGRIAILPLAVLAASLLISYERAKAEALGYDAKGGLMERAERLLLLAFGLLFYQVLIPVLWVMLVLSLVTAGQRFAKVWKQASAEVPARPARLARTRPRARAADRRVARSTVRQVRRRTQLRPLADAPVPPHPSTWPFPTRAMWAIAPAARWPDSSLRRPYARFPMGSVGWHRPPWEGVARWSPATSSGSIRP